MAEPIKYVETRNVRSPEMKEKWLGIERDGVDPFDPQYVEKYIGGKILLFSDHWYAFENDHKYSEDVLHQFVIPSKNFYRTFSEVPPDASLDLDYICQKLVDKFNIKGGVRFQRFGDPLTSGASVIHLHAQLMVPKPGKKITAWFGSEYSE